MEAFFMFHYNTIREVSIGEFKDKGSKFLAYAYPFIDDSELKEIIETLRKEHIKARHFCFAYKIGLENDTYRANDDGEPNGTAGKPILNVILSRELSDVLVVVVRYFGGSLLGVPGLINAYKSSTEFALDNAEVFTKYLKVDYEISLEYEDINHIMKLIKTYSLEILKQEYHPACVFTLRVNQDDENDFVIEMEDLRLFEFIKL